MSPAFRSRLQVLSAALLFSTGGMAIKSCSLSAWQVASFRSGVAALALLVMLPAVRRLPSWREVAVGAAYGVTLVLFVTANKMTTAANTIFLQSTAPLYVMLLAPLVLGERARRRDLLVMAVIGAGLALFFVGEEPATRTAPAPLAGNVLAGLAGLTWALTVIGLRAMEQLRGAGSAAGAVVAGNVLTFFACLPMALPVVDSRPVDWAWIGFLGVVQIGVAYLLLTSALRFVPAFETSLLLLVEPIFNPLWAFWVHGEVPRQLALAGGALVLLATTLKTWLDFRRPELE